MAEPITIKGGSLTIETQTLEFEKHDSGEKVGKKIKLRAQSGKNGKITRVRIKSGAAGAPEEVNLIIPITAEIATTEITIDFDDQV
jgi:hypothetical protein